MFTYIFSHAYSHVLYIIIQIIDGLSRGEFEIRELLCNMNNI